MSTTSIIISAIVVLLSLYIAYESFEPICDMPGTFKNFCHKAKYVLAFGSSLAFIYYAGADLLQQLRLIPRVEFITHEMRWVLFGSAGTISLFVWPRMVWRIKHLLHELDELEDGSHYL